MQLAQDDDFALDGLSSNNRGHIYGIKKENRAYSRKSWTLRTSLWRMRLVTYLFVICSLFLNIYLLSNGLQKSVQGPIAQTTTEAGTIFTNTLPKATWLRLYPDCNDES